MRITLQYFDGCPNWQTTSGYLQDLADGAGADVDYELIDSHDAAVARGFRGSPTVLIDGVDPFSDEETPVGLACRIYCTEDGYAGSPSFSQLQHAIRSAKE